MHPGRAAVDDIGRRERGEIAQPKTRPLCLAVAKLPRLDCLARRLEISDPFLCMAMHERIFYRDTLDWRIPEIREKAASFVQISPQIPLMQPANAGQTKPGAGRMRDHEQIPPKAEEIPRVAYVVPI